MRVLWVFSLGVYGNFPAADTLCNIATARTELRRSDVTYDYVLCTGGVFDQASGQTIPVSGMMAQELSSVHGAVFAVGNSTTTRGDVREGVAALQRLGLRLKETEVTVISERWHTKGIWVLLNRYQWGAPVRLISSDYVLGLMGVAKRLLRLPLYRFNPDGNSWFT